MSDLIISFLGTGAVYDLRERLRRARRRRAHYRRGGLGELHWTDEIQRTQQQIRRCPSGIDLDFWADRHLYRLEACFILPAGDCCDAVLSSPPGFDSGALDGYEAVVYVAADPSGNPAMNLVRLAIGRVLFLSQVVQIQSAHGGTIAPVGTRVHGALRLYPET